MAASPTTTVGSCTARSAEQRAQALASQRLVIDDEDISTGFAFAWQGDADIVTVVAGLGFQAGLEIVIQRQAFADIGQGHLVAGGMREPTGGRVGDDDVQLLAAPPDGDETVPPSGPGSMP